MDAFEQCRKEMDAFISTISPDDSDIYFLSVTGRLFIPYKMASREDMDVYLSSALGLYEEVAQKSRYDVTGIISTLHLLQHLNKQFN